MKFTNTLRNTAFAMAISLSATGAQAMSAWEDYSSFWVLGDSLSDTGRIADLTGGAVPGPLYYEDRFSNGEIWADYFLNRFQAEGKAASSIAFGGATASTNTDLIPDLAAQSGLYRALSAGLRGARPLVAIWLGGNDIGNTAGTGTAIAAAETAATNIAAAAIDLLDTAQDFLIFNMPDVGATPRFQAGDASAATEATDASDAFNVAIAPAVDSIRNAGGNVTFVDVSALDSMLAVNGIVNTTTPCVIADTLFCDAAQAAASQYWDPFHPTAGVHKIVGEAALGQFGQVPIPAGLPLMLTGLAGLALLRKRS